MAVLTPTATAVSLGTTDSVKIEKNVLIVSTDGYGINGTGSNQTAQILGTVYGDLFAVTLGTNSSTGNQITVTETGMIYSPLAGLACRGVNATVTVQGLVQGGEYGILLAGFDSTGVSTITNSGTITSAEAIIRDSTGTTDTIELINSGLIEGTTVSYGVFRSGHDAKDLITNTGTMIGDINFDAGDDRYDGRNGSLDGEIHAGLGNDTLMGGSEDNVFLGEAGLDKLTGSAGADQLTGGAEADQFIYKSTKDSTTKQGGRDTIMDFSHEEADQISLKSIDANTRSGGDQKFAFIGQESFHGRAGELRFSFSDGDTLIQGDVNGDKKADFAILLFGQETLVAGDFIL